MGTAPRLPLASVISLPLADAIDNASKVQRYEACRRPAMRTWFDGDVLSNPIHMVEARKLQAYAGRLGVAALFHSIIPSDG
jgi:hypothetical protein